MNTDSHRYFNAETRRCRGILKTVTPPCAILVSLQRDEPGQAVFVFDVFACITQVAICHCATCDRVFAHVGILRVAVAFQKQRKTPTRLLVLHIRENFSPFTLAGRFSDPNLRCRTANQWIEILPNAEGNNFFAIDQDEMNADWSRAKHSCYGVITIFPASFWSYVWHKQKNGDSPGNIQPQIYSCHL